MCNYGDGFLITKVLAILSCKPCLFSVKQAIMKPIRRIKPERLLLQNLTLASPNVKAYSNPI